MTDTLSQDNQQFVAAAVAAGRYASPDALLDAAVTRLREEEEVLGALRRAHAEALRGEGIPFEEAHERLLAKHAASVVK